MSDEKHEYGRGLAAWLAWTGGESTLTEGAAIRSALEAEARVPEMLRERDETIARLVECSRQQSRDLEHVMKERDAARSDGFARGVEAAAKTVESYAKPPAWIEAGEAAGIAAAIRSLAPAAPVVDAEDERIVDALVERETAHLATKPLAPARVSPTTIVAAVRAAADAMTPEEKREQAVSFAYGNAKLSNPDVTREMAEQAYDRMHPPAAVGDTRRMAMGEAVTLVGNEIATVKRRIGSANEVPGDRRAVEALTDAANAIRAAINKTERKESGGG